MDKNLVASELVDIAKSLTAKSKTATWGFDMEVGEPQFANNLPINWKEFSERIAEGNVHIDIAQMAKTIAGREMRKLIKGETVEATKTFSIVLRYTKSGFLQVQID